eukprot:scaffold142148_cov15-Tisochrysis_lutea.AAC.1
MAKKEDGRRYNSTICALVAGPAVIVLMLCLSFSFNPKRTSAGLPSKEGKCVGEAWWKGGSMTLTQCPPSPIIILHGIATLELATGLCRQLEDTCQLESRAASNSVSAFLPENLPMVEIDKLGNAVDLQMHSVSVPVLKPPLKRH